MQFLLGQQRKNGGTALCVGGFELLLLYSIKKKHLILTFLLKNIFYSFLSQFSIKHQHLDSGWGESYLSCVDKAYPADGTGGA